MTTREFQELIACIQMLKQFFNDDDKVSLWMTTENPMLGEAKPIDFFWKGRGHKVRAFIKSSIEENFK